MEPVQWMSWVRELQAISQTGLTFQLSEYDKQRYTRIGELAAEMLAAQSNLTVEEVLAFQKAEFGYATPKVDVRGVVFREGQLMLVREVMDQGRWTLPGGWADPNETPSASVEREVWEESGFQVKATELLAVYDREKQGHQPSFPYTVYKMFFRCEILGGEPTVNAEASEIRFFTEADLAEVWPELSHGRVTQQEIRQCLERRDAPPRPARFD